MLPSQKKQDLEEMASKFMASLEGSPQRASYTVSELLKRIKKGDDLAWRILSKIIAAFPMLNHYAIFSRAALEGKFGLLDKHALLYKNTNHYQEAFLDACAARKKAAVEWFLAQEPKIIDIEYKSRVIRLTEKGRTALILAVLSGDLRMAELLLRWHASPWGVDLTGKSALEYSKLNAEKEPEIFELLDLQRRPTISLKLRPRLRPLGRSSTR